MMKTKKGVSHVEIIISFVIFIAFLIFILIVFKPLRTFSAGPDIDITKAKILDYVSVNLSIFSLKINSTAYSPTANCFNADFNSSLISENLIMKNEAGIIINATLENDNLYFNNSGMFYKLYSSTELEEKGASTVGCYELDKSNYTLGVERTYKKVSYTKLDDLFEEYNNYDQLKQNLGLKNDFNILVMDNSRTVIADFKAERYKPEDITITAADVPIEILDKDANLLPAIMNIQVW